MLPSPSPPRPGTDQVYQLLIADLPLVVALCQGHQHVQLGGVQGQLMAVHEAGERLHADEAGVLRVKLLDTARAWPGGVPGAAGSPESVPPRHRLPHAVPLQEPPQPRRAATTLPLSRSPPPAACQPGSHEAKHTRGAGTILLLLLLLHLPAPQHLCWGTCTLLRAPQTAGHPVTIRYPMTIRRPMPPPGAPCHHPTPGVQEGRVEEGATL